MSTRSFRVHGCGTCKKRKIKCDKREPQCTQCLRLRKPCPGVTAGLIFIHTSTAKSSSNQVIPQQSIPHQQMPDHPAAACLVPHLGDKHDVVSRLAIEIASYHLSPWTPHPWMLSVPQVALSNDLQQKMLLPFQAMQTAFVAMQKGDLTLRDTAFRYYSNGLARQKEQVSQLVADKGPRSLESILHLLLMSMALLDFEMMAPTGPDSWIPHGRGALYLLQLAGPHACQKSPFFEIFWHLRFCMAYVTLVSRRKCYLSHDQWIQVPFLKHGKTDFDRLIDSLLVEDAMLQDGCAENRETISGSSQNFQRTETDDPNQVSDYQRIYRLLANLRDLVVKSRNGLFTEECMALATSITADSEHFMDHQHPQFNVALQICSGMTLVANYSPCPMQRVRAAQKVAEWHGRFVLRSLCQ